MTIVLKMLHSMTKLLMK